jgi:flagellar protein FlgJ
MMTQAVTPTVDQALPQVRSQDARFHQSARETAQSFEAFFIARFIDAMQEGVKTDGPFGGGHAEAMFRGMLSDQIADSVSGAGGLGIADAVYREILKMQEV